MKNHRFVSLWRAWLLVLLAVVVGRGEDFLYVVAVSPGRNPEIHWVPVSAPLSARVLVEDLRGVSSINRFGKELWWWPQERVNVVKADLVGEAARVEHVDLRNASSLVRLGDVVYKGSFGRLERLDLKTGFLEELVDGTGDRLTALALYEDRLYFAGNSGLVSVRVDGTDRRTEAKGPGSSLFGRSGVAGITIHRDQLVWIRDGELWQMNLKTREQTLLAGELQDTPRALAVSDTAIYWIGDRMVWRRDQLDGVSRPLYQLGDTRFLSLAVASAEPYSATITQKGDVVVQGKAEATYQLLQSEDLQDWSPLFLSKTLFSQHGKLEVLSPLTAKDTEPLVWRPRPVSQESYFCVWEYDLGAVGDSDGDGIADYWERRFFGDLGRVGKGDFDGDGLSDLEEYGLLTSPILTDTDSDGLPDIEEARNVYNSSPSSSDTDGDGLIDGAEVLIHGTDPGLADSDSDQFTDDFEIANGSDPNQSESVPAKDSMVHTFAEALLGHFKFEELQEGVVQNAGLLGGSTNVIGPGASILDPESTRTETGALRLNQADDESAFVRTGISLGDLGFNAADPEFTIAFWIRPSISQSAPLLSFSPSSNAEEVFGLFTNKFPAGDSLNAFAGGSNARQSVGLGSQILPNVWTHVAWAFGEKFEIYLNGEMVFDTEAVNIGPIDSSGLLSIGAPMASSRGHFEGDLDDLRVYNRAVSANVVALLAR